MERGAKNITLLTLGKIPKYGLGGRRFSTKCPRTLVREFYY